MSSQIEEEILRSLRRITRAIDLHSKALMGTYGLTGPQLVCLRAIGRKQKMTPTELARVVSLSQGTVTGIVSRLVTRQLVRRERAHRDRRSIYVSITQAGADLIAAAPSPLQERFSVQLDSLSGEDQEAIRDVLDKVVQMMGGADIEAAPVLEVGAVDTGPYGADSPENGGLPLEPLSEPPPSSEPAAPRAPTNSE